MRHTLTTLLILSTIAVSGCATGSAGTPSCTPCPSHAISAPAPSGAAFDPGDGQFDVVQLYRDAKAAIKAGRNEEALSRLLWAFDDGPIVKEASVGVIAMDVPALLVSLGKDYPPALRAI